jgi:putative transposase
MLRTIRIRLPHEKALIETIRIYSEISKYTVDVGFKNKTFNKVDLHKQTYYKIRKKYPNFPSALVQTVRDVSFETLKRTKFKKKIKIKQYTSIRLDKRNLDVNLKDNIISISSISGSLKIQFKDHPQILKYKDWKPIAGTLSYKCGNLFLNLIVEKETPKKIDLKEVKEDEILGIDRGINNILVCSNTKSFNIFFHSKHLKRIKGQYQYLKPILQSKGTRSAKRHLKRLSGREQRFVFDTNHCLSKMLANSDFKVFVLEDLKRMTKKKLGKKFNRKLGNWSFRQFEMFLRYKCEALGKIVLNVNPKYTSQTCSVCGHQEKANRNGNIFKCKKCGFELHSDLNAARNIANLGKSEIRRLSVNQPIVASDETKKLVKDSYKPTISMVGN